jgi:tetratricopeptide (TPR) repeat protein
VDREAAYSVRADIFTTLRLNQEAIADLTQLIGLIPGEFEPYQLRAAAYLEPPTLAFLGIGTSQNSLLINTVQSNMPAEKAGIRVGDIIVRVGSLRPVRFDQVSDRVMHAAPGDPLEIEIERNGERKVLRAKLVARPPELDDPPRTPASSEIDRAIGDIKRAIELARENPRNHFLLSTAYSFLDRHDESISSMTEAIRLDPLNPLPYLSRARAYLMLQKFDQAIADVNEALRQEAEGGLPYMLRGLAYGSQGKAEEAKADLAKAVRLDPKLKGIQEAYEKQLAQQKPAFPVLNIPQLKREDIKVPEFGKPKFEEPKFAPLAAIFAVVGLIAALVFICLKSLKAKDR